MLNRLTALATLLALGTHGLAQGAQLPPAVSRAMARVGVPAQHLSIYVRDAGTNEVVVDLSSETPRSPASTIKVLTTFAALDMLGPAYTWKTRAYAAGRVDHGVLHGDLYLVGGGDPYMTDERWWSFVQSLRERGLAKITGDVVIDNNYFAPIADSRADFDAQPFRSYNVLPDALMVNFQSSRFTVNPFGQRSRPQIVVNPLPANLVLKNEVRLGTGRCKAADGGIAFDMPDRTDPNTLVVRGVFPVSCGVYSVTRAIMTAPDYAYGTFRTMWTQSGGVIDGACAPGSRCRRTRACCYEYDSLPLAEIIRLVNKFSNNVMARHLLLTLGAESFGRARDGGARAQRDARVARKARHPCRRLRARERLGSVAHRARHSARHGRDARRRVAQSVHAGVRRIAAAVGDGRHAAQSLQLARHAGTHSPEDRPHRRRERARRFRQRCIGQHLRRRDHDQSSRRARRHRRGDSGRADSLGIRPIVR